MPLVQAGELLSDLQDDFVSYLRLSMCGVWRERAVWFRGQCWGSPCCWRDGSRAKDPKNAPCQAKI